MEIWLRNVVFSALLVMTGKAIDPSCECLVFSSTFGKEYGRFSSPDFPKPYPPGINCLLYTFIAGSQEIIELTFFDFNVHQSVKNCSVGDRLKVFLDLDRPEVNEMTPWSGMLCGTSLPVLYSSGPVLILELQTDNVRQNQSTGFRGVFRFIDTSSYKTEGQRLPGTACDYQFINGNHSHTKGKFYSPQYPSSYPKNSRCTYRFRAKSRERIRIVFEELNFQKGDVSCLDREDVLKAHDGGVVLAPVVAVLCNEVSNFELISTSNQLYLEFASSSLWPGHGFTATYHFEPVLEMNADLMAKLTDTGPAVSATRSNCDIKISSDMHKQGQIFSPGFPVGYLSSTKCRYEFQATGKERIRIVFTYFNLATKSNKEVAKECNGEDSVTPYISVDGRWEKLESFCGTVTPKPVLSNGPRLVLEFTSFNSSKGSGGFRAEYKFVKDFAVRSGKQLSEYPCAFRYTWQEAMSGNIHSPNFPGLYPRDTECHYFFHGAVHQKIKVHFHFFDIEGIHPCDTATDSDYVEFFNFMTKDEAKMYTRHCGQLDPFDIVVDRRFFRVTFRSNDRLDGHGFNATYHFIDVKHTRKVYPPAIADHTTRSVSDLYMLVTAACLLLR